VACLPPVAVRTDDGWRFMPAMMSMRGRSAQSGTGR
jgi:hypothetical protein